MGKRLLRAPEVEELTGLSRTTIWRLERAGDFPPRRQLSANVVAWVGEEVEEWIEARPVADLDPAAPGTR